MILSFIRNLRLSFTQYAVAAVALLIGGLVAALKVQGSRLHKAQVDLLQAQFSKTMDIQDAAVETARTKLKSALAAYHDAGGEL